MSSLPSPAAARGRARQRRAQRRQGSRLLWPYVHPRFPVRPFLEAPADVRLLVHVVVMAAVIDGVRRPGDADVEHDDVDAPGGALGTWRDHVVHREMTLIGRSTRRS